MHVIMVRKSERNGVNVLVIIPITFIYARTKCNVVHWPTFCIVAVIEKDAEGQ